MKKPLLDVIFNSGKRKDTLLLLQNGPMEMESLLKSQDTTRVALLPQIKVLEEHHLVFRYDDIYELTTIGKLIVNGMKPLVDTLEVLDVDIDYWGTHRIDFIPEYLIKKMFQLKTCSIVIPNIVDIHNEYSQFSEFSSKSCNVYVITEFLFPNYVELFNDLISNNVTVHFILSPNLLEKIKNMESSDLESISKSKYVKFFVYKKELDFLSFGLNDCSLIVRLLRVDGANDNKFIWCKDSDALQWAKDLFDHYLKDSIRVTKI